MSREIKFRAWTKDHWINDGMINDYQDTIYVESNGWDEFPIMQYTGFKDKNGKEIYDGDIIGDWTDVDGKMEQSKQTVYFDEMLGGWMLDNSLKQDRSLAYSLHAELQDFEYEIIGNIYENPELLATI